MKTTILFGSPKKHGETKTLVDELTKHLEGDINFLDAYELNIKACIDCGYCKTHKGCSIKNDDMQLVYDTVEESDNIIIASPMHFANISAELQVLFSRFQTYYSAIFIRREKRSQVMKKKKGVLLMTAGTSWPNMMLIPEGTTNMVFDHLNTEFTGRIYGIRTDKQPIRENEAVKEQAKKIAALLNERR